MQPLKFTLNWTLDIANTHFFIFDLDLEVKVTWNVVQYPLHHVSYAPVNFEVTLFNGLGGDRITRNVMGGQRTDRLWYEINITIFF